MSEQPIASYSFLPWARQGLGGQVQEADQAVVPGIRATIGVTLTINADKVGGGTTSQQVPRNVEMYGPGDVVGIDAASIVRSEPRHWITNFETNYLPYVEFYEEDFPWRYTPAKSADGGRRMRPWLTLVVLAEDEFVDRATLSGGKLPVIEATDSAGTFPDWATQWAWAHVHVNGTLGGDPNDQPGNATRLGATVAADRDSAYSRLLSPRVLRANTAYHAFVVPSFESGRLAGLGKDPGGAAFPTQGSWVPGRADTDPDLYPVYHRWYFRTGEVGDFEYLVRLLQPRTVDARVGRRPIDVQDPGSNLPPITGLGGVVRLGGALRAPLSTLSTEERAEYDAFEGWAEPYPHPFQDALARLVNLGSDYQGQSAADANAATGLEVVEDDEDPIIVPPLYGRWHAQVSRLTPTDADPEHEHWVDELNHDPRHRVAAGLGTGVVQKNQEAYMEAAWQQVGKVLEGNSKIRFGHLAMFTSMIWHRRELARAAEGTGERLLAVTAPVHQRVLSSGKTIAFAMRQSTLPQALLGTTFRKVLRPRARVTRLGSRTGPVSYDGLITRVNDGEITVAPPKTVPDNLPTGPDLADDLGGGASPGPRLPPVLVDLLRGFKAWRIWFWVLAVLLALLLLLVPVVGPVLAVVLLVAAFLLYLWLSRGLRAASEPSPGSVVDSDTQTPETVDDLPTSSGFEVVPTDSGGVAGVPAAPQPGPDSPTAIRFKEALRNAYAVDGAERGLPVVVREPMPLDVVIGSVFTGIDPTFTVPKRVLAGVEIPGRISSELVEDFGEVMVYPEIDLPMYEPLEEMSSEYLVPNIQLVEANSITLLETNQKFIEAYLVGLNHEFARELLWREYPTDQRGSYFRQFWDVGSFLAQPGADPAALRERLRDVPELHTWSPNLGMGSFDHREQQGDKEEEVVLTIRGELLKKYPTAVIYAHRAAWERTSAGAIDRAKPRKLADLPTGTPPRDLVKTPLYEAKVAPDIYFFGFDLTAETAKGGQDVNGEEDPGWFFVIKERPGEPRFGLDLPQAAPQGAINTWNELSWTDVVDDYTAVRVLPVGQREVGLVDPGAGTPEKQQHDEDKAFRWRADTHAAELAYILYQVPVLMAVHAAEMLQKDEA
ncbi:hypothetical protein J2X46_002963 [Nocardioides sp. BE266]|uniref:hypothetical protein n=1 Tax=Nocardioides sp. BE266 TaxID=2817725 RepID=UPI002856CEE0|nr:hypothetical protein [Nocardioides sp. BE266]MDR7253973.1 hypothetical protein [Nocardioides sp. BE266]